VCRHVSQQPGVLVEQVPAEASSPQRPGRSGADHVLAHRAYSHRIDQILDRYDPVLLAQASHSVGDHDDELPLRPEESTR